MTPDDLDTVDRSWSELRRRRARLFEELTDRFAAAPSPPGAALRAEWLLCAVEELVGLLTAPSQLAVRARDIGTTWPDPLTAPCYALEGRAWMDASRACLPTWSVRTESFTASTPPSNHLVRGNSSSKSRMECHD